MSTRSVAVFTYGQLFEYNELYRDQPFVAKTDTHKIYSSGRLEKALKQGHVVHVVCTTEDTAPHDAWWTKQVPKSQIHLRMSRYDLVANQVENDAVYQQMYPWWKVCTAVGAELPEKVTTIDAAKAHLRKQAHVLLGESIAPWDYRSHP